MQTGQYAAPPPHGQTPEPAEPSFDDILQSFQAPSEDSAFAPPPAAYSPQPLPPSSASGTWAAPGTPPQNPAWQQSQPYAPGASWQAASPAASPSSLRSPQPPVSPDPWGQPPAAQNPAWQASNAGNPQQAWAASRADAFAMSNLAAQGTAALPVARQSAQPSADVRELRQDEDAIRRQVATLRDVAASIHEAAVAMEDERSELRSFLDGSRDALERLEEWAGQQMGLDLRQSPEAVRRYLPLSVIWVTTTRLKKLATLLTSSGRAVTNTEEQIEETLNELRTALNNVGPLYGSVSAFGPGPDGGFSATVAQVTWNPPAATPPSPPVPTVDSAASTASLSPGARAELERSVREQLRRELEDDVRAEVAAELRRDEEDRIRQEIQIQVRRQLLAELTPGFGSSNVMPMGGTAQVVLPQMASVAERAPKPVRVTSEQSPEALEVFRDEAQEHLQSITTGLAQLERDPGDTPVLQSVRRAMHTLKGAAGMMGFTRIQQTAHASEDLLDKMVEDQATLTSEVLSLLLDTSEALDLLVTGAATMPEDDQDQLVRSLMTRYSRYAGAETAAVDEGVISGQRDATQVALADDAEDLPEQKPAVTANDLSVRLQLSKLDDLVNLFGELLINRSVLEERVDRLNRLVGDAVVVGERLRDVGSQLDTRFEAATLPSGRGTTGTLVGGASGRDGAGGWTPGGRQNGSGGLRPDVPSFANEFDELELDRYTEFHRLSRGLSEGVADMVTLGHEMEA
ncbi:MAG TPA: Hpt domain-containing protein, partial [Ktedonobacterales bacterium]|nr:Hpt domain-containing protein [Ktedonobacterales bacterium]